MGISHQYRNADMMATAYQHRTTQRAPNNVPKVTYKGSVEGLRWSRWTLQVGHMYVEEARRAQNSMMS